MWAWFRPMAAMRREGLGEAVIDEVLDRSSIMVQARDLSLGFARRHRHNAPCHPRSPDQGDFTVTSTRALRVAAAIIGFAGLALSSAAHAQWKPTKPINIIVPWAAGGATDQMIRITAGDLE